MTPPPGTPSDWVSGERVFAPPRGTVDVDWLVPAVLELVPGASPAAARAALEAAHRRSRGEGGETPTGSSRPADVPGPSGDYGHADGADRAGVAEGLDTAAHRVLAEALETFGS